MHYFVATKVAHTKGWHGAMGSMSELNQSWVWTPSKAPVVSLSKKLYPYCFFRNKFKRDFATILK